MLSPRCLNARKIMVWGALRLLRVLMSEGKEVSAYSRSGEGQSVGKGQTAVDISMLLELL